jgi:hypothetical protein
MARWRRRPATPDVPERLARFVAAEWPGGCSHERLQAWKNAAADWLAADTAREPRPGTDPEFARWWLAGGSRRRLPFGECGDAVDLLREEIRYHREMPPCPGMYRPAQQRLLGRVLDGCQSAQAVAFPHEHSGPVCCGAGAEPCPLG